MPITPVYRCGGQGGVRAVGGGYSGAPRETGRTGLALETGNGWTGAGVVVPLVDAHGPAVDLQQRPVSFVRGTKRPDVLHRTVQ